MPQHDYDIANQAASAARSDINLALKALASTSSGATAPSITFANQLWYDTSTDLLKMRNEANSAWITLGTVDQTNNKFEPNYTPATNPEALAGTDNTKVMTPLRVKERVEPVTLSSGTLNDVASSRVNNTTYQNTGSTWKAVTVQFQFNSLSLSVGPTAGSLFTMAYTNVNYNAVFGLVPPGWYYRIDGSGPMLSWKES